jgi:predicted house-cleaning noncanonical NTP pyrophosphatase (MazG superfamily)
MSKQYDKILKENIGNFFITLSEKYLGIKITKSEEFKDKLQTTLEREAVFLRLIYNQDGEQSISHLEFQTDNERDMVFRMQEYHAILQKNTKFL